MNRKLGLCCIGFLMINTPRTWNAAACWCTRAFSRCSHSADSQYTNGHAASHSQWQKLESLNKKRRFFVGTEQRNERWNPVQSAARGRKKNCFSRQGIKCATEGSSNNARMACCSNTSSSGPLDTWYAEFKRKIKFFSIAGRGEDNYIWVYCSCIIWLRFSASRSRSLRTIEAHWLFIGNAERAMVGEWVV